MGNQFRYLKAHPGRSDGVGFEYARHNPDDFSPDPAYQVLEPERGLVRLAGLFNLVEQAKKKGELFEDSLYIRLEAIDVDRGTVLVNATRVCNGPQTSAYRYMTAVRKATSSR